jgi:hypothetical protein
MQNEECRMGKLGRMGNLGGDQGFLSFLWSMEPTAAPIMAQMAPTMPA